MTKKSETIIFFGNERLATGVTTDIPALRALITAGYNVAAVVANYERGTSRNARELEIAKVAAEHNIPLLLPERLRDIEEELRTFQANIGVLVAYGKLVPSSTIELFPKGIVNIHPSLLPLHRGPTPIESVILASEPVTGVSLMRLVKAMDAGPVYAQEAIAVDITVSKQTLADTLLKKGADMLLKYLPAILNGSLLPKPQDDQQATYDEKIHKEDGIINWQSPAEQIERQVRAYQGWPKSRTTLAGKEVAIIKAHIQEGAGVPGTIWREGKKFGIYTVDNILVIDALKPAGKQEMNAEAFLAGYGKELDM